MPDSTFATLVYAVLDHDAGVCRFTSAGHPPPLVVYPDGRATYLEGGRGPPLGTFPGASYRQQAVALPTGSTVVLYTDGLVERRGETIDDGLERLRAAAESGPGEPDLLVEHLLSQLVGDDGRGDDVAVLACRLLAVAPKPLELRLPGTKRSLDVIRDALRVWLQRTPASQQEAHDILLAVWEACANAIEHPAGVENGSLAIKTTLADSGITVTVRDSGAWLPPTERSDRGLGLELIRASMTSVDISESESGTLVRLQKQLADDAGAQA
jgi:anti-sigma regulatory factor (Ser/Thr protein kinase)